MFRTWVSIFKWRSYHLLIALVLGGVLLGMPIRGKPKIVYHYLIITSFKAYEFFNSWFTYTQCHCSLINHSTPLQSCYCGSPMLLMNWGNWKYIFAVVVRWWGCCCCYVSANIITPQSIDRRHIEVFVKHIKFVFIWRDNRGFLFFWFHSYRQNTSTLYV